MNFAYIFDFFDYLRKKSIIRRNTFFKFNSMQALLPGRFLKETPYLFLEEIEIFYQVFFKKGVSLHFQLKVGCREYFEYFLMG